MLTSGALVGRLVMQRAVYHARMHKHAQEGRLKPGIPTDVSESLEFIKRLHEFRQAYPGGGSTPAQSSLGSNETESNNSTPQHQMPTHRGFDI